MMKFAVSGDAPYFITSNLAKNPTSPPAISVFADIPKQVNTRVLFVNMLNVVFTNPLKPPTASSELSFAFNSPQAMACLLLSDAPGIDGGKASKMMPMKKNAGANTTNPNHHLPTQRGLDGLSVALVTG